MFWWSGHNSDFERLCYKAELFGDDPNGMVSYYRSVDLNKVKKNIRNRKILDRDKVQIEDKGQIEAK